MEEIRSDLRVSTKTRKDIWCLYSPGVDATGVNPIRGGQRYVVMRVGKWYLYQTAYATKAFLELKARGMPSGEIVLFSESKDKLPEWYEGQDLKGKTLLLLRQGGIGDLIMLTPLINGLRRLYDCRIVFATAVEYSTVLDGIVDRVVSLPLAQEVFEQFDYFLHFTETIEKSPGDPDKPASDMFIEVAGIDKADFPMLTSGNRSAFSCNVDPLALRRAYITKYSTIQYNPAEDILVAVQPRSNNIIRNIPPETVREILLILGEKYKDEFRFVPVLLDRKKELWYVNSGEVPFLVDFREKTSIKDFIALISLCDMVVAPDSSAVHIAGAFGIPTVALYGAFTPKSRVSYYPECRAIVGGKCIELIEVPKGKRQGLDLVPFEKYSGTIAPCSGCMNQEGCTNTDVRGYSFCMLDIEREEIRTEIHDVADKIIEERKE